MVIFSTLNTTQNLKTILIAVLIALISACGGGGGSDNPAPDDSISEPRDPENSTPNPPGDETADDSNPIDEAGDEDTETPADSTGSVFKTIPYRFKQIDVDLDNNGVIDATAQYSYDDSGRRISTRYKYSGDTVADVETPLILGAGTSSFEEFEDIETYDDQGRLKSLEFVYNDPVFGTGSSLTEYQWNSNTLEKRTEIQYDPGKIVSGKTDFVFSYTAGLLNSISLISDESYIDLSSLPSDLQDDILQSFIHHADASNSGAGLLEQLLYYTRGDELAFTIQFKWNASNQITSYRQDYPSPGSGGGAVTELIYDSNHCLLTEKSRSEIDGSITKTATTTYTHDPNTGAPTKTEIDVGDDGIVDIGVYYTIENEPQVLVPNGPDYFYSITILSALFCEAPPQYR